MILEIISIILSSITIILLVVLLLKKSKISGDINSNDITNALTKSISKEMLEFSAYVNKQLAASSQISNEAIANFRVDVNKELAEFKGKLNDKLQEEFGKLSETVDKKMMGINEKVEERLNKGFESTNETFVKIKESMAVMESAQKNIEGLSNEMLGLQNILTNNQQRGAFGEYQLEQLLYSTFGENKKLYDLQYTFNNPKDNETVRADSVIFMPNGLICIDSKFPYSNYVRLFNEKLSDTEETEILKALKKDVKEHINTIADKYIVEGVTVDFAVMFVPSDGLLSLLHLRIPEIIEYSRDKNIIIVSPTTIIPLIASYRIVKIDYERSKYVKQIGEQLVNLSSDFKRFTDRWDKLSKSIDKLSNESNDVSISVKKLTNKFDSLQNSDISELVDEDE